MGGRYQNQGGMPPHQQQQNTMGGMGGMPKPQMNMPMQQQQQQFQGMPQAHQPMPPAQ